MDGFNEIPAVKKIVNLKLYKGKLEYIPVNDWEPKKVNSCETLCKVCHKGDLIEEKIEDLNVETLNTEEKMENLKDNPKINKLSSKNEENKLDYSVDINHGPSFKYIGDNPEIKDEEWVTLEADDFVSISVGNVTHLSHDMIGTPYAHWSDGYLDMGIMRKVNKMEAISLFTKLEKGEHVGEEGVFYKKVKAIRLFPDPEQTGYLDVDGEKLPYYEPLSIELHRGLANLILPISDL